MEALATMNIAERPTGQQGRVTREVVERSYYLVGRTDEHGVVDGFGYGRAQGRGLVDAAPM